MDILSSLSMALAVIFQPENLIYCFLGCLTGTLIGVLPGIGPVAAMSILLPSTYRISPVAAIIMLGGIYYGAMYGGSTTSILVNIPGEAASVVTCLDGYQMARKGRAGSALGIAAFGSFIAGTISTFLIMLTAPPLARFALRFGAPEFFSLMIIGLLLVVYLSTHSILKSLVAACLGLFFGSIGTDLIHGVEKFTLGLYTLKDGLGLIPLVMGLFGVSEVLVNLERVMKREIYESKISNLLPTRADWKRSAKPILRGSVLGFLIGILPGSGAIIGSFASYVLEKKLARNPGEFGRGAIEGVAGPESANNSASQGSFIPLLTLGIPSNAIMAVLFGALVLHGINPGPLLIKKHPDLFWGVIGSMYLGNLMLLVLNLPLIGFWVRLLRVPYRILFPLILFFCLIGAYTLNNNYLEVILMVLFGILGYLMKKLEFEPAPLVLAFILSPQLENTFRQSLIMSHGSPSIFFTRPISLSFLLLAAVLAAFPLIKKLGRRAA